MTTITTSIHGKPVRFTRLSEGQYLGEFLPGADDWDYRCVAMRSTYEGSLPRITSAMAQGVERNVPSSLRGQGYSHNTGQVIMI